MRKRRSDAKRVNRRRRRFYDYAGARLNQQSEKLFKNLFIARETRESDEKRNKYFGFALVVRFLNYLTN